MDQAIVMLYYKGNSLGVWSAFNFIGVVVMHILHLWHEMQAYEWKVSAAKYLKELPLRALEN